MTEAPAPDDRNGAAPVPADMRAAPSGRPRVRRPTPVTILAIIQLFHAVVYGLLLGALIAVGSDVLGGLSSNPVVGGGPALELELEIGVLVALVGGLCVAALLAGILLLRMRQLGWTLTMLLAGLSLVSSLVAWLFQGANLELWLLVEIVTVFYLNQRQVREAFGISGHLAGFASDRPGE